MQRWRVRALGEAGRLQDAMTFAESLIANAGTGKEQDAYRYGLLLDLGDVAAAGYRFGLGEAPALARKVMPYLLKFHQGKVGGPGYTSYSLGLLYAYQSDKTLEAVQLLQEALRLGPQDSRAPFAQRELRRLQTGLRRAGPLGPR